MRLKLNVLLLSICGLGVGLPLQSHAFDGVYLADRESAQQDRRDARQARRDKRLEQQQQAEPVRQERREPERGYGYGYERRHYRQDDGGRGRR